MTMQHTKQASFTIVAILLAAVAAFAQDGPRDRDRSRVNPVAAATEAFGFTEEQVDKIREIRRERMPRGQSSEERDAWRAEQKAKVEAVLTDEQKAKVVELAEARASMQAYAGAAMLGLVDVPNRVRAEADNEAGDRRGPTNAGRRVRAIRASSATAVAADAKRSSDQAR